MAVPAGLPGRSRFCGQASGGRGARGAVSRRGRPAHGHARVARRHVFRRGEAAQHRRGPGRTRGAAARRRQHVGHRRRSHPHIGHLAEFGLDRDLGRRQAPRREERTLQPHKVPPRIHAAEQEGAVVVGDHAGRRARDVDDHRLARWSRAERIRHHAEDGAGFGIENRTSAIVGHHPGDAPLVTVAVAADDPGNERLQTRHADPPLAHDPRPVRKAGERDLAARFADLPRADQVPVAVFQLVQFAGCRVHPEDARDVRDPAFGDRLEGQADAAVVAVANTHAVGVQEHVRNECLGVGRVVGGGGIAFRLHETLGRESFDRRRCERRLPVRGNARRVREHVVPASVQGP